MDDHPPIFVAAVTLGPIILMTVEQYTHTWKGYLPWSAVGMAFISFALLPILSRLGVYELHHFSYFYHFLIIYALALFSRFMYKWVEGIQSRRQKQKTGE